MSERIFLQCIFPPVKLTALSPHKYVELYLIQNTFAFHNCATAINLVQVSHFYYSPISAELWHES